MDVPVRQALKGKREHLKLRSKTNSVLLTYFEDKLMKDMK